MRDDDESAYVAYVSGRLPVLHRAAYLLCGDAHRADDVVQSTITRLYRRWDRARRADSLDAYVHRMLVRQFLDERRLGWARVHLLAQPPERAGPPADSVEERDELRTALAALPRTQRTVLVLRYLCDLSVDEVADIVRCSPSTPRVR